MNIRRSINNIVFFTTSSVSDPKSRRSKGMAATKSMMNQPL